MQDAKPKKVKLTPEQKRALEAYKFAEAQEERLAASVFANRRNMIEKKLKTEAAYLRCKQLGMDYRHGL